MSTRSGTCSTCCSPGGIRPRRRGSPAELVSAIVETEPRRLSETSRSGSPRAAGGPRHDRRQALKKNSGRALRVGDRTGRRPAATCSHHEPIPARPDTLGYRAAKFVGGAHRRGVAAAAGGAPGRTGVVGFYTSRLASERDRARLRRRRPPKVSELLTGLLTGADPYALSKDAREPTVRDLLDAGAARIQRSSTASPSSRPRCSP